MQGAVPPAGGARRRASVRFSSTNGAESARCADALLCGRATSRRGCAGGGGRPQRERGARRSVRARTIPFLRADEERGPGGALLDASTQAQLIAGVRDESHQPWTAGPLTTLPRSLCGSAGGGKVAPALPSVPKEDRLCPKGWH